MSTKPEPPHLPQLGELTLERTINFATQVHWGISDPARFFALMDEVKSLVSPGIFLSDNLLTWGRNNSALEDVPFRAAWESNQTHEVDQAIVWRRYILACAAYHCVHMPGDFVECGVLNGTGIKTVMDYLGGPAFPKTFWGYDTYDYNPVEGHEFDGQGPGLYDTVAERFDGYPQVRLVKGLLPDSFAGNMPDSIAYLHIDLNNAAAEIAVLDHLFDRVSAGGIVILDDYEWSGFYREQKKTEDPWFAARNYRVFPLPTGQGLVLKR